MTLSRRAFAQILGAGAAAAALPLPRLFAVPPLKPALVRLNANENPYGPSPAAIGAMRDAFGMSSRYPDDEADALVVRDEARRLAVRDRRQRRHLERRRGSHLAELRLCPRPRCVVELPPAEAAEVRRGVPVRDVGLRRNHEEVVADSE